MLSLTDLKKFYIQLYTEVRNYIWDFNTVRCLAELEIAVFRRFPDISEVRNRFASFYSCVSKICAEDDELSEAVDAFKDAIHSNAEFYSRIVSPKEV